MRRRRVVAAALALGLTGGLLAAPALNWDRLAGPIDEEIDIPGVHDCWGIRTHRGGDGCR